MAHIVSTIGSSHRIEQVISEAREHIIIVTPYLKISAPIFSRLVQADKRGVKILMMYGKTEMEKKLKAKLECLQNINLYFLADLHAKCYLNESSGLLTSMNLYEYSQVNNWELGVSFDGDSAILRDQILGELELMVNSAESKMEKFKRFALVKKSYAKRLTEFLNNYFKTDKFIYEKEEEEYFDEYFESLSAIGFPHNYMNISIYNDGSRIDFVLNLAEIKLEKLKSNLNLKIFNDEFRVYHNRPDCISMYSSIFHRDKWESYSDKFKSEYIAKGIERMAGFLEKNLTKVKV